MTDKNSPEDFNWLLVKEFADKNKALVYRGIGDSEWSQTCRNYEGRTYRIVVAEYGKDPLTLLREKSK